ncbi:chitin elicitor receptor kinase 1-like [Malania oleifera]|uniref:chitin elicitor receptor kinase 1-like n=1 Tax=Malania oleifera TaxID=397392 RepID=UPI0025ADA4C3|nr:chitin elicitor receptor kinase 1-like [Malania oleifera]
MGHPEMRWQQPLGLLAVAIFFFGAESKCSSDGCDLALASYYLWSGCTLTFISRAFSTPIDRILSFNPQITDRDLIFAGTRVNVPFSCDCIDGDYMGHEFKFTARAGATYRKVAGTYFSNLTTVESTQKINIYDPNFRSNGDAQFNVFVNCSCGNSKVSKDYGLFVTYPLRAGETLETVANAAGVPPRVLQEYNPNSNFSLGKGLVFFPGRDQNGDYPPLKSSTAGVSRGVIAGIAVAVVVVAVFLTFCLYTGFYKRNKVDEALNIYLFLNINPFLYVVDSVSGNGLGKASESAAVVGGALPGITVSKSVEYSYEELAKATNDFSMANKIGEGGFGCVYYAELRGERAAIKKMDMQASKEFLAELRVLTHVHHSNLVRLIGYCAEGSLFLVYEFIENGNLSQHLHCTGREPLPWTTRVQIALDSARGLEYIHEQTVPVYIHRDIKSSNILIDNSFHGKVADFGLTKLTEVGGSSLRTQLVGTFGYMPPEYAQYGDISPKIDVYAFGVVLYELISAKEAIVKGNESITEPIGLVALFEDAFSKPDPVEDIRELVDPKLGNKYPIDSVYNVAQLAKACTQERPQQRPSMRSVVVSLTALLSSTGDWDVRSLHENQHLLNLMSAR